jgi:hypothetical protein
MRNVSYCQDDRKGNNIFCFIAKESPTAPKHCYAFKSDDQAAEIMHAIGNAFTKATTETPGSGRATGLGDLGLGGLTFGAVGLSSGTSIAGSAAVDSGSGGGSEVEQMRRKLEQQEREAREMKRRLAELEVGVWGGAEGFVGVLTTSAFLSPLKQQQRGGGGGGGGGGSAVRNKPTFRGPPPTDDAELAQTFDHDFKNGEGQGGGAIGSSIKQLLHFLSTH